MCDAIPFLTRTDCVCVLSACSTRRAAAFTYTQATHKHSCCTALAHAPLRVTLTFLHHQVFYVCMAVDVFKLPFEFEVRWCKRIARCMALRKAYEHRNWILLRWRCRNFNSIKFEMKNIQLIFSYCNSNEKKIFHFQISLYFIRRLSPHPSSPYSPFYSIA